MFNDFTSGLLLASLTVTKLLSAVNAAAFPPPVGPLNTTLSIAELIDHHRNDPFAPASTPRRLMISIFQPTFPCKCSTTLMEYIEPITAAFEDKRYAQYGLPSGTFERLHLQVCKPARSNQNPAKHQESRGIYPLVLFSPGLGDSRLFYSALAQEISSFGYIVVTVDHPYDADIVVFPDNTTILGSDIETDDQVLATLNTRTKDISFVIDQLSLPSVTQTLLPNLAPGHINTSKLGIYGHSLGGATAAEAMLRDKRLVGGINLDGTFFGDVVEKGLDPPFLIFAHEGKNRSTDASWQAIWPKLRGWKRELMVNGSAHGSFMDLRDVLDVLDLEGSLPSEVEDLLGSIGGQRALDIVSTYVGTFFDFVLKGKKSDLLDGPSKEYPEVEFASA